eukprot:GHVS01020493.1.p1 GENE.GHVS01020493.1~~GHVS01020493.1.p1  ORF type:complete len:1075 (+),score=234.81 GHVS01020493.1:242-3466(+)
MTSCSPLPHPSHSPFTHVSSSLLRYRPLGCAVLSVDWWQQLIHTKLHVWKLQNPWLQIEGSYAVGGGHTEGGLLRIDNTHCFERLAQDQTSQQAAPSLPQTSPTAVAYHPANTTGGNTTEPPPPAATAGSGDCSVDAGVTSDGVRLVGWLKNFNTLEEFKAVNRSAVVQQFTSLHLEPLFAAQQQEDANNGNYNRIKSVGSPDLWKSSGGCGSEGVMTSTAYSDTSSSLPMDFLAPSIRPFCAGILERLSPFLLLTFIDIKNFVGYYSLALPVLRPVPPPSSSNIPPPQPHNRQQQQQSEALDINSTSTSDTALINSGCFALSGGSSQDSRGDTSPTSPVLPVDFRCLIPPYKPDAPPGASAALSPTSSGTTTAVCPVSFTRAELRWMASLFAGPQSPVFSEGEMLCTKEEEEEGKGEEESLAAHLLVRGGTFLVRKVVPTQAIATTTASGASNAVCRVMDLSHIRQHQSPVGSTSEGERFWYDSSSPDAVVWHVVVVMDSCGGGGGGGIGGGGGWSLGWPSRNLIFALSVCFSLFRQVIPLLAFRDAQLMSLTEDTTTLNSSPVLRTPQVTDSLNSVVFYITVPDKAVFVGPPQPADLTNTMSATETPPVVYQVSAGWMKRTLPQASIAVSIEDSASGSYVSSAAGAGYSSVFVVYLRDFLDSAAIQSKAVELNIQLMKWREVPTLNLDRFFGLKVLLLGAGTLGCAVARNLLGWGVRNITFVDSGRVSMSNPVRQHLYTHQDAASNGGSGRYKAVAARDRLLEIRPDANCQAVCLDIPMPGHARYASMADSAGLERSLFELDSLIASHDVVLLLTDSRESRWLPSLLVNHRNSLMAASSSPASCPPQTSPCCSSSAPLSVSVSSSSDASSAAGTSCSTSSLSSCNCGDGTSPPLCVCVALGFDSFVVMRHSYRGGPQLACYFCNDISAPSNSIANTTLDQQCTVTRPGVATLSSSLCVELLAALLQHSQHFAAPHSSIAPTVGNLSPLGATPHTMRGSVSDFHVLKLCTEPFAHCICCSPAVVEAYSNDPLGFVTKAVCNSLFLEEVSGLAEMKACVREEDVLAFEDDEEVA